jgi:hypothetical protein
MQTRELWKILRIAIYVKNFPESAKFTYRSTNPHRSIRNEVPAAPPA